jgi:hypothetical protein
VNLERVRLREQDVTFRNGGVTLAGTVLLPQGAGPFPAFVLAHGSGPETRNDGAVFAYLLAHHGVASIRFDKRSTGQSRGGSIAGATGNPA